MKQLLIILYLLLLTSPLFGQSELPETIVIPISSMGDVSDTRKQILQNTLEEELKDHFILISKKRLEEVQETVFEKLDYEECTEDQCILMIQEALQVENVFNLLVIGEGSDTQLSLSWRNLEEKKKVNDVCMECGTFDLNGKVRGLVAKLVGEIVVEETIEEEKEEEQKKKKEEELRNQKERESRKDKDFEEYFKLVSGFFINSIDLNAKDTSGKYSTNNEFKEEIRGSFSPGLIARYFIKHNISIDILYSSGSVSSVEYSEVKDPDNNIDYSKQEHVSGNISSFYLLGNYVWNGGEDSWMSEGWSIFAGGGYGSTDTTVTYERSVILIDEKDIKSTLSKNGLSYSFGFDYTFENNWLGGLYYSAISGEGISGTRIDDLEQYYSTKGAGSVICLSVGYNFK